MVAVSFHISLNIGRDRPMYPVFTIYDTAEMELLQKVFADAINILSDFLVKKRMYICRTKK